MNKLFHSKFWRAMDFLATMFMINCLWLVCCLPVITIGASSAAMCHSYFRIFDNRSEPVFRLFKNGLKSNLKQATLIWFVYLVFLVDVGIVFWSKKQSKTLPAWVSSKPVLALAAVLILLVLFTVVYIFSVIAYYDCTSKQALINSLGLSFYNPAWTVLLVFLGAATGLLIYIAPFLALLAPSAYVALQCKIQRNLFLKLNWDEAITNINEQNNQ